MQIITPENKAILVKRLKSLLWRIGMMVLALIISFAGDSLSLFSFPAEVQIVLGLVLGEISKYLNTQK